MSGLLARTALAFAAGCLMPFAFAPAHHLSGALLGLTIWAWLLWRGRGGVLGFAFGLGWFGTGAWWLSETIYVYGHLPAPLAWLCVLLVGGALALFPALWGWLCTKLARSPGQLLLVFPLLGAGEEWLRGHLFTGLPWTALGNLLLDTPAVGWLAVLGVYGAASLVCLLAVACLLPLLMRRWLALLPLGATLLLLAYAPAPYAAGGAAHSVALIQPNIPQGEKWDARLAADHLRTLVRLTDAAMPADVIVWPEAALPFIPQRATAWTNWLRRHAEAWQADFLFGGIKLLHARQVQNGLYLWSHLAGSDFSPKQHLVPFGEYVPAWLPWLHKLVPDIGDFRPGRGSGVLRGAHGHFGTLVCYESIFPEQARARVAHGADVLVVVTNDAWYGHSPAAWQHFQAARARAVETGRYVLRSGNTGISAIIAPDGSVQQTMPWWTPGSVRGTYRLSRSVTPYQRLGDAILAGMLLIGGLIYWRIRG